MREVKNIVVHCSAGHTNAEKIQDYFLRPKSKGGRGWRTGGYHRIVEKDGTIKNMYPFERITNGVRGHNLTTIHICYVGGVDPDDIRKAMDTRTNEQKDGIEVCIMEAITWMERTNRNREISVGIVGHRDFSPDRNGSGLIEPYERIKECPSFDAMKEYSELYASPDRYNKLPTTT